MCAVDIDLDGDNDLVVSSSSNGLLDSLFIFYNDGIGNLDKTSISRKNGIFVLSGIIDADEYPDIITKDGSNILFIKNNGDGTYGEETSLAPSQSYRVIDFISDVDGDNLNDMVYTYSTMYIKWGILKNEGNLLFSDHVIFDAGNGGNLRLSTGALNSDNLSDISLVYTQEGIHVLMNNGDLTFDSLLICSIKAQSEICNLNLTPPQDILIFSDNTDQLLLYENLGDNEFSIRNTIPLVGPVIVHDVTDYNNDGYDDFCYAICWWVGCTDSLYIAINDENWSFIEPQRYYVGPMYLFGTTSADLNGDNYLDIIMFGFTASNLFKILWNDGSGGFTFENPVGIKNDFSYLNNIKMEAKPNPFHSSVLITIKSMDNVELRTYIIDVLGRIVKEFNSGYIKMDNKLEFIWDGKDNSGKEVVNGIYYLVGTGSEKKYQPLKIIKY